MNVIIPEAMVSFFIEDKIFRPSNLPNRFFKIYKRTKQLKIAANEVASAKPACLNGPIKIRFKMIFKMLLTLGLILKTNQLP